MDFSYFDQYQDSVIDLSSYLKSLSVSGYSYTFNNTQPVTATVKNLFTKYDIIFDYRNNIELILNYEVQENETIELVSYKVYGDVQYWWIIALFNNITNIFTDWPLTEKQVKVLANDLYDKNRNYNFDTYFNYLNEYNFTKRQIILPKPDTIKDIIWKYRQVILADTYGK